MRDDILFRGARKRARGDGKSVARSGAPQGKEAGENGAVERELQHTPDEPRRDEREGERIEEVLVEVDESGGEQPQEETVRDTLTQRARASESRIAPDEQKTDSRREGERKRDRGWEIGPAQPLQGFVRAPEDDEMEEAVPDDGEDEEKGGCSGDA
jgi:hypothetical protein